MTRDEFLSLLTDEFERIVSINKTKGRDYAGESDALSNFKRHAAELDLRPEQIWAVYASKHWDAVMTYCRAGQVESEPIEERLRDVILYGFLLLGLVREGQQFPAPTSLARLDVPIGGEACPHGNAGKPCVECAAGLATG